MHGPDSRACGFITQPHLSAIFLTRAMVIIFLTPVMAVFRSRGWAAAHDRRLNEQYVRHTLNSGPTSLFAGFDLLSNGFRQAPRATARSHICYTAPPTREIQLPSLQPRSAVRSAQQNSGIVSQPWRWSSSAAARQSCAREPRVRCQKFYSVVRPPMNIPPA